MNRALMSAMLLVVLCALQPAIAATWCVSPDGAGGCYTSINSAISAAANGDTIKVLPGMYNESVDVDKQVVILGSGHEVCAIAYNGPSSNAAISFNTGSSGSKITAMRISNTVSRGVFLDNYVQATIANCLIAYNNDNGIFGAYQTTIIVRNCIIADNVGSGINSSSVIRARGTVFYRNSSHGIYGGGAIVNNNCYYLNTVAPLYGVAAGPNDLVNINPQFVAYPTDLHLLPASPCINTGIPGIDSQDCDGSANDIGIYGGPDAVCGPGPVVENLLVIPPAVIKGETFKIQAKGVTR